MRVALALLVFLLRTPAFGDGAHETAAGVAHALRGLRTGAPQAIAPTGTRRVLVVVTALTPERRLRLEETGLIIERPLPGAPAPAWRGGEVVQGLALPGVARALARLPFVRAIETPGVPWTNVGAVTSEGDAILTSDTARAVLGTDGTGTTVGVISDGADSRAASVATGDLPADVTVVDGLDGQGDEGTALLEIVHDVAPGARLLFAAPQTAAEMVSAIGAMESAGAHVIVDDIVFTDEPKFEDGPIALAARRFIEASGVYVTAAGNFARTHYIGTYRPRAAPGFRGLTYRAVHGFAGQDVGNSFRIPARADVIAVLQWNDAYGRTSDDFDLVLARHAARGDTVLAASTDMQAGAGNPYEALRYVNGDTAVDAYLAIAEFSRAKAPADVRLDLHVFSRVGLDLQYTVSQDSIFGHAAVEEVLSVAAAPAADADRLEAFSAQGPASIFFPARVMRQVPRLTAVDAVETSIGRRGRFVNPFRGTSAAAPHVAGCAALLVAAGASAATTAAAMQSTAVDLLSAGFDPMSGAGRLDCGAAGRLATGRARPPVIGRVAARFDATGAIVVDVEGDDADGDVRSATIRLLDRDARELASETVTPAASGPTGFASMLVVRAPAFARARMVSVQATDATHLDAVETASSLACPGDASLGDALCAIGDLLELLAEEGRPGRRLARLANRAAKETTRAGLAVGRDRTRVARRALARAAGALRGLERRTSATLMDAASEVRARIVALRADLGN